MLTVTATSTDDKLTTLAAVKAHLEITSTDYDESIEDQIAAASDIIATELGYWPLRQRYTETVKGYGDLALLLSRTPVRAVDSITVDGTQVVDPTTYSVDPNTGFVRRELGWPWSAGVEWDLDAHILPKSERERFSVDYEAGWVLTTSTGNLSASGFLTSSGGNTLPRDIEHATIEQAKTMFLARKVPGNIQSKSVGDLSITYRQKQQALSGALTDEAAGMLQRWLRFA